MNILRFNNSQGTFYLSLAWLKVKKEEGKL